MTPPFAPTHVVPDQGLASWVEPDPSAHHGAPLPGRLPLQVTRRLGEWAQVVASNGWTGWVDARLLVAAAPAAAPAGVPRLLDAAAAGAAPVRVGSVSVSGPLVGSVLAGVGILLDWVSFGVTGRNSLDVPLAFLWEPTTTETGGVKVGMVAVLLVALGVAAALGVVPALARRVAGWGLLGMATAFVAQLQRAVGQPEAAMVFSALGLGVYLTAAGGALLIMGRTPDEARQAKH